MTIDTQIFFWLNNLAGISPKVDFVVILFADYIQYALVLLFLVWASTSLATTKKRTQAILAGVLSAGIARGIVTPLIRLWYQRPRPFSVYEVHQLVVGNEFSFPSGHSIFFFALSTAIYMYDKRCGICFYIVSALVGISRIMAGVHYPTDVLSGAILGIAIAYGITYTIKSAGKIRNL